VTIIPELQVEEAKMVRLLTVLLTALLCASPSALRQAPTSRVPLEVVVDGPTDDARAISGHMTNVGTRTATAWSLRIAFTYADRPQATSYLDRDNYQLLVVPAADGHGPLRAGESVAFTVALPSNDSLPIATSVVPVAVVYDDRTAVGQKGRVDAIFSRRLLDVDAANELVSELQRLVNGGDVTSAALQQLATDLKTPVSPVQESGLRSLTISNISIIIAREKREPGSLRSGVVRLISLLGQYMQAAQQHSQRR